MARYWLKISVALLVTFVACTSSAADSDQDVDLTNPELQKFIAGLSSSDQDLVMKHPSRAGLFLDALHQKGGDVDAIQPKKRQFAQKENDGWSSVETEELLAQLEAMKDLMNAKQAQHHSKSGQPTDTEKTMEELLKIN